MPSSSAGTEAGAGDLPAARAAAWPPACCRRLALPPPLPLTDSGFCPSVRIVNVWQKRSQARLGVFVGFLARRWFDLSPCSATEGKVTERLLHFVDYVCPSIAYVYNEFIDMYKGAYRHYI